MYERMLNKHEVPAFEDLINYCGRSGKYWIDFENYLASEFEAERLIRFPYGKKYGWGAKYSQKNKHICDVFAEDGAFTVFFQISSDAVDSVLDVLDEYAKEIWEDKYPCSSGGWVRFRVLNEKHLENVKKLVNAKMTVKKK